MTYPQNGLSSNPCKGASVFQVISQHACDVVSDDTIRKDGKVTHNAITKHFENTRTRFYPVFDLGSTETVESKANKPGDVEYSKRFSSSTVSVIMSANFACRPQPYIEAVYVSLEADCGSQDVRATNSFSVV